MEGRPRLAEELLPPVLWEMILSHVDNTELWTQCRRVCSLFQEAIEYDFKHRVLQRDTTIEIDLDWDYLDQENSASKTFFGFQLEFDRFLDSDEEIAVFSRALSFVSEGADDEESDKGEYEDEAESEAEPLQQNELRTNKKQQQQEEIKEKEEIKDPEKDNRLHSRMEREKLEEKFSIYTPTDAIGAQAVDSRFDLPPWTIEIGGLVNDTELPGWKFDFTKHELSFKWRDAMETFFRESNGMRKEARRLITSPEFKFRETELRAKYPVTSDDDEVQMQRTIAFYQMVTREETTARRKLRRHRLKKFWTHHRELDPDKNTYKVEDLLNLDPISETLALKRMRQMELDGMWV